MREEFTSYATGDVELFQDFLERSDILEQDKIAMLEAIAKNGWDECLEVWIGREEPLLETRDGQQAWVTMAGEGHTDCWMQMAALAGWSAGPHGFTGANVHIGKYNFSGYQLG